MYYQILMIAKMNKTEISAKIPKRKKINVFIIRITPKTNQHMPNMKQIHKAVQAPAREQQRIFAAILDFVEEAEKRPKNLQGKFPRGNMHSGNI